MPETPPEKRVIIVNPDEPRAGDYAYSFYEKSHPIIGQKLGDKSTVNSLRRQLRGLRNKEITLIAKGATLNDEGTVKRWTRRRSLKLTRYTDIFGPGGALTSILHQVRELHSDETIILYSLTIETQ